MEIKLLVIFSIISLLLISFAVYFKLFSYKVINEHSGKYILAGQITTGFSAAEFKIDPGQYIFKIKIESGKMTLLHNAFNEDGGSWSIPVKVNGDSNIIDIKDKEYVYNIILGSNSGKLDKISVYNLCMCKNAVFTFSISKYE